MKVLRLKHLQLLAVNLLWQNSSDKLLHCLATATQFFVTLYSAVIHVLCILGWVFLWVQVGGGWNTSKNIGFLWRVYSLRITINHQPNLMSLAAGSRRAFEAQYKWIMWRLRPYYPNSCATSLKSVCVIFLSTWLWDESGSGLKKGMDVYPKAFSVLAIKITLNQQLFK